MKKSVSSTRGPENEIDSPSPLHCSTSTLQFRLMLNFMSSFLSIRMQIRVEMWQGNMMNRMFSGSMGPLRGP